MPSQWTTEDFYTFFKKHPNSSYKIILSWILRAGKEPIAHISKTYAILQVKKWRVSKVKIAKP